MTNMFTFQSQKCRLSLFIKTDVTVPTSCCVTSQSMETVGHSLAGFSCMEGRAEFGRVKRAGKGKGCIGEELLV